MKLSMPPAVLLVLLLFPAVSLSDTLHVPGDHATIQEAIDAAVNGDTVLVDPGTYVENIDFSGKAITVASAQGPAVTVIDGNKAGTVVVFTSGEGPDSILEGFTVTNGHAGDAGGISVLMECSPVIRKNRIVNNTADENCGGLFLARSGALVTENIIQGNEAFGLYGGGIYCCDKSTATITKNLVADNTCGLEGGGIFVGGATTALISENTITGNSAYMGGGIFCCNASPTISKNFINGNHAEGAAGGICSKNYSAPLITENLITENTVIKFWGGGIFCPSSAAVITRNVIAHNSANQGGGLCCSFLPSTVTANEIYENTAVEEGGGIYCKQSNSTYANNRIFRNEAEAGGGVFCFESSPIITNNTVYGNIASDKAGGIGGTPGYFPAVMNSIIWGNTPDPVDGIQQLNYCVLEGGWVGPGNIQQDPRMMDPDQGDFHITYISPCRNMGWNHGAHLPGEDFEGDPRCTEGTTDIGADEFCPHLYCTGEPKPGGQVAIHFVGFPGTAPVGLVAGFALFDPPLKGAFGTWFIKPPWILLYPLFPIPGGGIGTLPVVLPASPPGPYTVHLQALIGDALTNLCTLEVL